MKYSTCPVYDDDVIFYFDTFEEHFKHIEGVLRIMQHVVLALNIANWHLFRASVDFLGHVVVSSRLKIARRYTAAMK